MWNEEGWTRISKTEWRHSSGLKLWIKHSQLHPGRLVVVCQMDDYPMATIDYETYGDFESAEAAAKKYMEINPDGL